MGSRCSFKAYVNDSTTLKITVADAKHPIAKGVEPEFTLNHDERYSDPYRVPKPGSIVFDGVAALKSGGVDPSHQGYCWTIGKGRMFYFQVGHETNPVFYDKNIRKIMANAVAWAAPSRSETAGLAFHYDQPNSEPPQALLQVTPSQFTGNWRWDDLVDSLHATLDMARKRAVEPDHVDDSVYGRFLPPIVSLASPMPMTATLNLVLNNEVFFAKVTNDE